jgi:hypothetical protein
MTLTPEQIEAIHRQVAANNEWRKEMQAQHDLAVKVIEAGYKILRSRLRPKLPIDQKHLKLLKVIKAKLLKCV